VTTGLYIAGSDTPERAIDALLELDEPCGTCIFSTPPAIATIADPRGWRNRPLLQLMRRLSAAHGEITRVTPPSLARGFLPKSNDWIEIDLGGRGERMTSVTLARSLFDGEMLFGFANLDRPSGKDERIPIAIGLWSHFARGLERLGSRLSDERTGLTAEVALAVVTRRYYVTATIDTIAIALSTTDPVAAELAGRGLLRLIEHRVTDESVAPWEAPLVQRSIELGLGVRTPDEIAPKTLWRGPGADANRFATVITQLSELLSLPVPAR
jgi:hypothetical protein